MNIGFDAKRIVQNNTGLGNYSRFVVEVMSEYFPDNNYFLLAPKRKENSRLNVLKSRANVRFIFPDGFFRLFPSLWRMFARKKVMADNSMDLFHGLSNELPLCMKQTGVKTVVTVHDLIFIRYPQFYRLIDRLIYRLKFNSACRNADAVIAVSECTKRDIVDFFHIPEKKIVVIYQSCHPQFKQKCPEERRKRVLKQYGFPEKFVLFVGSIEERKNLLLAVKALKLLPEDVHLVAIGKSTTYQQTVEKYAHDNSLLPRVHIFNGFPFEEFPVAYQSAEVFVYPSFFEGFGIPVIEALWSGVPVIAATGSCLEEAGGPDSFYVDPSNECELASRISQILNDPALAKSMSEKGKMYVQQFDPKVIANQIETVYRSL
ncbi:MAG: glycosyltransferase family 4 protein [Dysgonamonadaceae bacterium]|jgi:glycosyltransferase involved in cell wall biosynthesis|nr:glycosyltransferase family 4 protein [Dysgonamonadaceae bacterium]